MLLTATVTCQMRGPRRKMLRQPHYEMSGCTCYIAGTCRALMFGDFHHLIVDSRMYLRSSDSSSFWLQTFDWNSNRLCC